MMSLNDMDWQLIKCIGNLYSGSNLVKGEPVPLQTFLEEAIKNKTGVCKDFSLLVASSLKSQRIEEYKPLNAYEETKGSNSDNELELDLLKEDLMCIVCNGMDVGARNRLLECTDCHALYHQECHRPVVTIQDLFDTWVCQNCKDANKKLKLSSNNNGGVSGSGHSSNNSPSQKTSSSHRHSSSSSSTSYLSSSPKNSDKYSKSSVSAKPVSANSTPPVSKNPSPSLLSSRNNIAPNINIISADKRIQNMKKKAAKLQEKRKLPR